METKNNKLKIKKIKDGNVIDHIPSGLIFDVFKILDLENEIKLKKIIEIGIHYESKKIGRKDILKIENVWLKKMDLAKLSLIVPDVTINEIRDYKVVKKYKPPFIENYEGVKCQNPNCISHMEYGHTKVKRVDHSIECVYCERVQEISKLVYVS